MTRESYVLGSEPGVQRYLARRSADMYAAFLRPHLSRGSRVLDCGCGPGSITLDLAVLVAPGEVVGIDIEPRVLETARAAAAGMDNVRFEQGDVYALPFADASFDVVYANTLLLHLREPARAVGEMLRVLRPGGVVAVSDILMSPWVYAPDEPEIREFHEFAVDILARFGANPRYASSLRGLLVEAGCQRVEGGGFLHTMGTYEQMDGLLAMIDEVSQKTATAQALLERSGLEPAALARIFAGARAWTARPDAFLAWIYCTGIGWKATDGGDPGVR